MVIENKKTVKLVPIRLNTHYYRVTIKLNVKRLLIVVLRKKGMKQPVNIQKKPLTDKYGKRAQNYLTKQKRNNVTN